MPSISTVLKFLLRAMAILIGVLFLLVLLLNTRPVQQWLTDRATQYLSRQTGTTISVDRLGLRLPRSLVLEGVYVEDLQGDTLLFVDRFRTAFSLTRLLSKEIDIREVRLAGVVADAHPVQGDTMNYQFLLDAFGAGAPADTMATENEGGGGWSVGFPNARLRLSDVDLYFLQPDTALLLDLQLQQLEVDARQVDLEGGRIDLEDAAVRGADFRMALAETSEASPEETSATDLDIYTGTLQLEAIRYRLEMPDLNLRAAVPYARSTDAALEMSADSLGFQVPAFQLRHGAFAYDTPAPRAERGFDYNHIDLDSIQIRLHDVRYSNLDISGRIEQLAAVAPGDFRLMEAGGRIDFSPDTIAAEALTLTTGRSRLSLPSGLIALPDTTAALDKMRLQLQLEEASISPRDAAYFVPQLTDYEVVRRNLDRPLRLRAETSGTLAGLQVHRLQFDGWNSRLSLRGELAYPTEPERLQTDLQLVNLEVAAAELQELLPPGTLPDYLELPQSLRADGRIQGSLDSLSLQLQAQTSRTANPVAMVVRLQGQGFQLLDTNRLRFQLQLDTVFATREALLAYLPPGTLPDYVALPSEAVLRGDIRGSLDTVAVALGLVTGRDSLRNYLYVHGGAEGIAAPARARFDLTIDSLLLTPAGLGIAPPDTVLPDYLRLPRIRSGRGHLRGTIGDLAAALTLNTDWGQIEGGATLRDSTYTLDLDLHHLDPEAFFTAGAYDTIVGRDLSPFALELQVEGAGFDPDSNLTADIALQFRPESESLGWGEGARLAGRIDRYAFDGQLTVREPGLETHLTSDINFNLDSAAYAAVNLELGQLDLQRLGLAERPMGVAGDLSLSAEGSSAQHFDGALVLSDIRFVLDSIGERIDSFQVEARFRPDANRLVLRSDFVRGFLYGRFQYSEILGDIRQFVGAYFAPADTLSGPAALPGDTLNDNLVMSLELFRPELLTSGIIPGLRELSPTFISGTYQEERQLLSLTTDVPRLNYRNIVFDSLDFEVLIREDTFFYDAGFQRAIAFDQFNAVNLRVRGRARNGQFINTLIQENEAGEPRFDISATAVRASGRLKIRFQPEALLNFQPWQFSPENLITLGRDTLAVRDWRLQRGDDVLQLRDQAGRDLIAQFQQFDLQLFSDIVSYDSDYLAGTLNGNISLYELLSGLRLGADVELANFEVLGGDLGNLTLVLEQEQPNNWEGRLAMRGDGHELALDAVYRQQEPAAFVDVHLDAESINLASLQPVLEAYTRDLSGALHGQVTIEGMVTDPDITGSLAFTDAQLRLRELGALWKLDDRPIEFRTINRDGQFYSAVVLSNFAMRDSLNNRVVVDGSVRTPDFQNLFLDLNLNADDFLVMNTTAQDNGDYHGYLRIKADGQLSGPFSAAELRLNVTPVGDSRFVYNYSVDQISQVESGEGIIEFRSFDSLGVQPAAPATDGVAFGDNLNPLGWDINVNAAVNDDLELRINTDPVTKDHFEGKGEGDLAFRLTPRGRMELTGRLEIVEGSYLFTYSELVKREFTVLEESYISWTGPVEEPELDVRAQYTTKATATPLVTDYESLSTSEQAQLKNRQEFNIIFILSGELDDLEVATQIEYPRNSFNANYAIVNDLINQVNRDESRTNTQAFSLLLFNGFASTGAGGASDMQVVNVQQSFSDLMTSYLNNVANQYINFVELDFDIESRGGRTNEYFETTDFRVSIKKTFLNERLEISVDGVASGGDEDNDNRGANAQQMQTYLDNITVEYALTKDGLFKVKVFNRRDVDDFLGGGQVIELGGALVFSKDFKSFRLFGKEKPAAAASPIPEREEQKAEGEEEKIQQ